MRLSFDRVGIYPMRVSQGQSKEHYSGRTTTLIGAFTVTGPSVVCRASYQLPCSQVLTLHTSTSTGRPKTHQTGRGLARMRKRASAPWNSLCPAKRSPSKSAQGIAMPASRCAMPSLVRRNWLFCLESTDSHASQCNVCQVRVSFTLSGSHRRKRRLSSHCALIGQRDQLRVRRCY